VFEYHEVVEPEFEPLRLTKPPAGLAEDIGYVCDLHAMVLVDLHAVEQPEANEDVEDRVHERRRHRDHEDAVLVDPLGEEDSQLEQLVVVEVLQDGECGAAIEALGDGNVVDKPSDQPVAPGEFGVRSIGVDPDARPDPVAQEAEQFAVVRPDVEDPRAVSDS